MNSFMDVSIGKQKVKNMKAHSVQEKHGYFVLHKFFAKPVACNEAQKNKGFQEKTKKKYEGSYNLGKTF